MTRHGGHAQTDRKLTETIIGASLLGRRYKIQVSAPHLPERTQRRTLYVLDGDLYFSTAVDMISSHPRTKDVVVAGIGYPSDESYMRSLMHSFGLSVDGFVEGQIREAAIREHRRRDFGLPLPEALSCGPTAKSKKGDRISGEVDRFAEFLRQQVIPLVDHVTGTSSRFDVLYGHSLAGLAVLYDLFTSHDPLHFYISSSPSLWWADQAIRRYEELFRNGEMHGHNKVNLMLTVGSDESNVSRVPNSENLPVSEIIPIVARNNMVNNVRELAGRLYKSDASIILNESILPDMDHIFAAWQSIALGVSVAFDDSHQGKDNSEGVVSCL